MWILYDFPISKINVGLECKEIILRMKTSNVAEIMYFINIYTLSTIFQPEKIIYFITILLLDSMLNKTHLFGIE